MLLLKSYCTYDYNLSLVLCLDGESKQFSDTKLCWWIVKSCLPFNIVESNELKIYLKSLNSNYKLPNRNKVKQLIQELYIHKKDHVINFLADVKWISLTTDGWKDISNQISYIGITAHFIDNYQCNSICLTVNQMVDVSTSVNNVKFIDETLNEFQIPIDKIVSITTDGGANYVAAGRTIGAHISCIARRLNRVFDDIRKDSELDNLLNKVRNIVTLFRQSCTMMNKLRAERDRRGKPDLKLIHDVITRWNSTYVMLERYLEMESEISLVLVSESKRDNDLSDYEIDIVRDITKLLKHLFEMTVDISGEQYVTVSRVIPLVSSVLILIEKETPFSTIAVDLKRNLLKSFRERFSGLEKNNLFAYASLLDPRFKKIDFNSTECCMLRVSELNSLLTDVPLSQNPSDIEIDDGIWKIHDTKMISSMNNLSGLDNGLKHFLDSPVMPRCEDPLQFWKKNKDNWPQLHNLALKYLTAQATSVPSERLFSKAGSIITEKRNRLKPKNVNMLCLLSSLPKFFY